MADNETTADIITWLRKPREGENAYLTLWRDEIADRLEAAHKRERGDCAKLREAIDYLCERMADMDATFDPSEVECLRAALAAPPRNCDRFATVYEARKAHEEYRGDYIMRASNKFDFPMKFEAWLFAPAAEKEGGAE